MFAFDLSDPKFSAPALNAPRPCAHASNCYYNGPNGCAFVHPGEEGTGMKIFDARTVTDHAGKETWQKATVRLIGGAGFYERRRLKMSWPQWCALPKNAHLQKPVKPAPAAATEPQLAPSVAQFFAAAKKTTVIMEPAPAQPLQVKFSELGPVEQTRAMFQTGYAVDTPEIVAARAAFMASFSPQARALNEKAIAEVRRQQMGNALYSLIEPFIAQNKEDMKAGGVWHDKITAGKITGMLLEALTYEELRDLLTNTAELTEKLAEACVVLKDAGDISDACATARQAMAV
jgi:hypothetical protein